MTSIIKLFVPLMALFVFTNCTAQIQNSKTETVKIYGNCGMCEKKIEKAAYQKGQAKADWDQDTKMAIITFDSMQTSADEVLQRIAAVGYDSDKFKATETAYTNLDECCQYERPKQVEASATSMLVAEPAPKPMGEMTKKQAVAVPTTQTANPLTEVYAAYFALKDALVATDGKAAAAQAKTLSTAVGNVKMEALTAVQHSVWMKYEQKLSKDAGEIQGITNTERQREDFATLSGNMYEVMKVVKPEATVYYAHCPMYGDGKNGNWLSNEKAIKNPYFGKKMLACGSVTETL